mmetsp:Transcript_111052/g.301384  ORF Transcript_111052/g.301384 Transcript_111052/m.301384 type:complete len:244 (-) Transcript_111052:54-785(-)
MENPQHAAQLSCLPEEVLALLMSTARASLKCLLVVSMPSSGWTLFHALTRPSIFMAVRATSSAPAVLFWLSSGAAAAPAPPSCALSSAPPAAWAPSARLRSTSDMPSPFSLDATNCLAMMSAKSFESLFHLTPFTSTTWSPGAMLWSGCARFQSATEPWPRILPSVTGVSSLSTVSCQPRTLLMGPFFFGGAGSDTAKSAEPEACTCWMAQERATRSRSTSASIRRAPVGMGLAQHADHCGAR